MFGTVPSATKQLVYRLNMLRHALAIFNNPFLQPGHGLTWCNQAVNDFSKLWDVTSFEGKLANDISDFLASSRAWPAVSPFLACEKANSGRLVIAHQKSDGHGHVAAVLPLVRSPYDGFPWELVPLLSMGRTSRIGAKARDCFQTAPAFSMYSPLYGKFPDKHL